MPSARLPTFIVIGAAKAATTWIAHQLRERPDIFLPGPEPHYFSRFHERGLDWYSDWFRDAEDHQLTGEKSADYLAHPKAPARMAAVIPNVRLIVQLRNPIERAYSDYCMFFRRGTVGPEIGRHLRAGTAEYTRFLEDGLYHRHLSRYLDHFPSRQIEIVLYDDIRTRPDTVFERVQHHIGLTGMAPVTPLTRRLNDSEAPMLPLFMRRLLRPAKPLLRRFRGSAWLNKLRQPFVRPVRYPPLTDDLRAYLADYYLGDVERLGTMLQRDLRPWLAPLSHVR